MGGGRGGLGWCFGVFGFPAVVVDCDGELARWADDAGGAVGETGRTDKGVAEAEATVLGGERRVTVFVGGGHCGGSGDGGDSSGECFDECFGRRLNVIAMQYT